jgi:hypothetical protein
MTPILKAAWAAPGSGGRINTEQENLFTSGAVWAALLGNGNYGRKTPFFRLSFCFSIKTKKEQMMKKPYILTLCAKCRAAFENTGAKVRRVRGDQDYQEKCTYCGVRYGYDYEITPKERRKKLQ